MARPRVFLSSTYYDLKHIRASVDLFIDSLGYDSVLSEKGDIAYVHDKPLDESCYREAENCDIFVLIIGGRYGTEVSGTRGGSKDDATRKYESITKKEYESAITRDVPIYILIEKGVYSEYQTYLLNKDRKETSYAHVDSVNVFTFIEEILSRPRNNPVFSFDRFEEIERWLRVQWAGLFRELLRKQAQQQQLSSLTAQVGELKAVNETLKTYLEAVMRGAGKTEASRLIQSEEQRLVEVRREEMGRHNPLVRFISRQCNIAPEVVIDAIRTSSSPSELEAWLRSFGKSGAGRAIELLIFNNHAKRDLDEVRKLFGAPAFYEDSSAARPAIKDVVLKQLMPISAKIVQGDKKPKASNKAKSRKDTAPSRKRKVSS